MSTNEQTSHRSRSLRQLVRVQDVDEGNQPKVEADGKTKVWAYGGLQFLRISGNDNHRMKRLLPKDPKEFFAHLGKELASANGYNWDELQPEDQQVVIDDIVNIYAEKFPKSNMKGAASTHMPRKDDGTPDINEFTIVIPKGLVVDAGELPATAKLGVKGVGAPALNSSVFAKLEEQRKAKASAGSK